MKKVLIITYYWPPAGGPGVQRWLKFVKYLGEFEIEPIVYIPSNPDYPFIDNSLEDEVSDEIIILRKKIFEPYFIAKIFSRDQTSTISSGIIDEANKQGFLQKILLFIRGNFFIPDARKFWIKPSVNFLSKYIEQNKIETIITTGPPHSVHLIGMKLKRKFQLKWIADFRDPWTGIGYHKKLKLTESSEEKHKELEQKVLKEATHIITTSFTTKSDFEELTSTPVTAITNGYDIPVLPKATLDEKFTLSHIGSLLSGRNPENLWKVLSELTMENKSFAEDFQLRLAGTISQGVVNSINNAGLEKYLVMPGYVSHTEAIKIQRSSQVLLLIEIDSFDNRGIIPGKLFEYLASKRPILAFGPEKWDVEEIINKTESGNYFSYKEEKELKHCILEYYKLFKIQELDSKSKNIEQYSRKNLTGMLARVIKNC